MIITLIHYRPSASDYCRGCLMGRSDSEIEIVSFLTVAEAAASIANRRFLDRNVERSVAEYETTVLIDGWEQNDDRRPGFTEWWDQEPRPMDTWEEIDSVVRAEFMRLVGEEDERKRQAEEANRIAAEARRIKDVEAQEQRDRAEFERLSAKFRAA